MKIPLISNPKDNNLYSLTSIPDRFFGFNMKMTVVDVKKCVMTMSGMYQQSNLADECWRSV